MIVHTLNVPHKKVIYSLNTKNDDLEYDMEAMRVAYEDKLQKVRNRPCQSLNLPVCRIRNSFSMIITTAAGKLQDYIPLNILQISVVSIIHEKLTKCL